jgi:hypothetical protein
MLNKLNKTIFLSLLCFQALSSVYSMTALEEPYEYVQCTKKTARQSDDILKNRNLRSSFPHESSSGIRNLMPRSREKNEEEDDKNKGKEDCITLILCDHGDEFNHWTDDCNGTVNIVSSFKLIVGANVVQQYENLVSR